MALFNVHAVFKWFTVCILCSVFHQCTRLKYEYCWDRVIMFTVTCVRVGETTKIMKYLLRSVSHIATHYAYTWHLFFNDGLIGLYCAKYIMGKTLIASQENAIFIEFCPHEQVWILLKNNLLLIEFHNISFDLDWLNNAKLPLDFSTARAVW